MYHNLWFNNDLVMFMFYRYLLTSQLQSTDARKTFPCMDEPALKATFDIIIERRTSKHSKSNTRQIRSESMWVHSITVTICLNFSIIIYVTMVVRWFGASSFETCLSGVILGLVLLHELFQSDARFSLNWWNMDVLV